MKKIDAIRKFFERKDQFAPEGGRKITNDELILIGRDKSLGELAALCAVELGVELAKDKVAA